MKLCHDYSNQFNLLRDNYSLCITFEYPGLLNSVVRTWCYHFELPCTLTPVLIDIDLTANVNFWPLAKLERVHGPMYTLYAHAVQVCLL